VLAKVLALLAYVATIAAIYWCARALSNANVDDDA
jgi:hypothetical protein